MTPGNLWKNKSQSRTSMGQQNLPIPAERTNHDIHEIAIARNNPSIGLRGIRGTLVMQCIKQGCIGKLGRPYHSSGPGKYQHEAKRAPGVRLTTQGNDGIFLRGRCQQFDCSTQIEARSPSQYPDCIKLVDVGKLKLPGPDRSYSHGALRANSASVQYA